MPAEVTVMRTSGHHPSYLQAWTPEDEDLLIAMRVAGKQLAVIAKALGRTQASCEARWQKIKKTRAAVQTEREVG
jgi:hypothetical protein